mmetsp:Transcript_7427/g.21686  ORF Transcript_7427/g.21686 Transcript_7427/m.21686 type:complete len:656 (+) Transcript_7427:96-2063(+)
MLMLLSLCQSVALGSHAAAARAPAARAAVAAARPLAAGRLSRGLAQISASEAAVAAAPAGSGVRSDMRNIAIVAHVDHGKTSLVDAMLQSAQAISGSIDKDDRLMDSNDQERERGITILAKNAAIEYGGTKVNIVDTPGHADFGGEVERVLNMVDGVLLLVDAAEGPKPQTRFVLKKALEMGHRILVVVNKIDKPAARPDYVIDKTFDLFVELGASDEQTDFPIVYTSAINRQSGDEPDEVSDSMEPLLKKILDLPAPAADTAGSLQLQISNIGSDPFIGRLGIGRVRAGRVAKGQPLGLSAGPGEPVKSAKISELFVFDAMGRKAVDEASAGDIVVFSGLSEFNIGDTLVDPADPRPLDPISVEEPTMSISIGVNKSPFAGKAGKLLTSRNIRERLEKELETNVALQLKDTGDADSFQVYGRGLLHLTVLIETMRREGFELMIGCPKVIEQEIEGARCEPFELVDVELPEEYSGSVISMLGERNGNMLEMGSVSPEGIVSLQYEVPSRAMAGVKTKLMSATRGLAVMTTTFAGYKPWAGDFDKRDRGNLLSHEKGTATGHGLKNAQERGSLFAAPGDEVYENQIVGIHQRAGDLKVNVCRQKQLTNMRSAGADEKTNLSPPTPITLEEAVEYIEDSEFVEVTPAAIRMGKVGKK